MIAGLPFNYKVYAKKNKLYVVIDYKDTDGKRRKKWLPTGLDVGTKKKEINVVTDGIVSEYYEKNSSLFNPAEKSTGEVAVSSVSEKNTERSSGKFELFDFMDKWLEYKKPRVSRLTYDEYCSGIRRAKQFFKEKTFYIDTIRPIDIQDYYNSILSSGVKSSTLKNRHLCMHNLFEYAVKLDLIPFNPTSRVELPKNEKHEATFYSKDELDALFNVFVDDRMELVVHIAAYYGLRRCEILGLQWDSVDFDNKTITVRRKVVTALGDSGEYETICENKLKTNATRRTLSLVPHIERLLSAKKKQQEYYRKMLRGGYSKEYLDFVCTDDFGNLIKPEYVTSHFRYIVDKNGLKHLRFHDLRHTCASLLIANHIPLKAIQDWLGHANFQTTIPVPNSNTKPTQYLPTIILISKRRFSRSHARNLPLCFSDALFNFRLLSLLLSLHIVLSCKISRFCAEYSIPQGLIGQRCFCCVLGVPT